MTSLSLSSDAAPAAAPAAAAPAAPAAAAPAAAAPAAQAPTLSHEETVKRTEEITKDFERRARRRGSDEEYNKAMEVMDKVIEIANEKINELDLVDAKVSDKDKAYLEIIQTLRSPQKGDVYTIIAVAQKVADDFLPEPVNRKKRGRKLFNNPDDESAQVAKIPLTMKPSEKRGLINLFQNLYDDRQTSGVRDFFQEQLAATGTQMKLSGGLSTVNTSLPELADNLKDQYEEKVNSGEDPKVAFEQVLHNFKQSYSWLSSVRMDADDIRKPKNNQDEHALPFLFMLLFGGGIASVPYADPHKKSRVYKAWKTYVQLAIKEDKNDEDEALMADALTTVEHYLESINTSGTDTMFYYKTLGITEVVLNVLREKIGADQTDSLLQNLLTLNYYGLYLSETDFNQWKSNLIFIKMIVDKSGIRFVPWISLIDKFLDAAEASFKECQKSAEGAGEASSSSVAAASSSTEEDSSTTGAEEIWGALRELARPERKSIKVKSDSPDYVPMHQHMSPDQTHYYPPGTSCKKSCTGFEREAFNNMKRVIDASGWREWKKRAKENMVFILDYLCKHYSRHLQHRVFLNCVHYKYHMSHKTPSARFPSSRGQHANALREGLSAAAASSPVKGEGAGAMAASQKKDQGEFHQGPKNTNVLDQFIDMYLRVHGINSEKYPDLHSALNGDEEVIKKWKKERDEKKKRKKKRKKQDDAAAAPAAAGPEPDDEDDDARDEDGDVKMGGRKTRRKKRRRKTKKRKIKRKKKTKRKKRRKRKKKTRRK